MNNFPDFCVRIAPPRGAELTSKWAMHLTGGCLHHHGIVLSGNSIFLRRSFWVSCPDGAERIRRFVRTHGLDVIGQTAQCVRCAGFDGKSPASTGLCWGDTL